MDIVPAISLFFMYCAFLFGPQTGTPSIIQHPGCYYYYASSSSYFLYYYIFWETQEDGSPTTKAVVVDAGTGLAVRSTGRKERCWGRRCTFSQLCNDEGAVAVPTPDGVSAVLDAFTGLTFPYSGLS